MKNTLSKTLICGIIASSFILVNCQKAPTSRGLKGTTGTPVAPAAQSEKPADKVADDVAKVVVSKCSPEFAKEYLAWSNFIKSEEVETLRKIKLNEELNEEQINVLKQIRKQLESKIAAVEPEIKKMQDAQEKIAADKKQEVKKLDGCFSETDGKKTEILFKEVQSTTNSYIGKIRKFDGVESDRTKLNDKEIEQKNAHSDVTKKAKYYISEELNIALDSADLEAVYFKEGKTLTGEVEKKKAISSSMLSVCYINASEGKIDDLEVTLNSMEVENVGQIGQKIRYKIMMLSGAKSYILGCDIPAKKSLAIGFREAMGKLLQSKEQREKAKVIETTKAEDKKEAAKEELTAAVKKAAVKVLKTKESEAKAAKQKEIEAVTKADKDAAEKARQQKEDENQQEIEAAQAT